ncbi:sterol desaturase family protein [Polyangium sp. y55x31]|uniref:sterol desaturase family protein n=1 Tax=Polyangium sp. y55x31 TaxID=3042688 RepID=UPI002483210C|nr:sterol desaturase family protein [Polyangium sp. y55x31]MDI1480309.1 sterol desaturase family protein [Polyangium sp. y55x31]
MPHLTLPTLFTIGSTLAFLVLERVRPGRALPHVTGWHVRALFLNLAQLGITLALNRVWARLFEGASLFTLSALERPWLEGLVAWFVGTFFYYWWHRLRHADGFWRIFHQIHHSPARIEILTSFYKHPVEMFSDALLSAAIAYLLLGISLEGAFWFNFFAATGEYFYHGNFKSPRWLKWFIQTPELHSVHHQLDVHRYNFSDLPLWDRLFGTYKDADEFAPACGFPRDNERKLGEMLVFRDVYHDPA